MAPFYLILALLVQCSLCYAGDANKNEAESVELVLETDIVQTNPKDGENIKENTSTDNKSIVDKTDIEDVLINELRTATNDWVDMFLGSSSDLNPSSSTSMMAQATNSNKSPEEQLEEIKEVASEITMAIQSEMTNLLSYALNYVDKEVEDNKLRKKRSIETPMDSSQLIMQLLGHIKSNNEYQNIAIEKMMSAQEIANKYGVEFNPDPEILTDLAFATNEQAKELTSILEEACDIKKSSYASRCTNATRSTIHNQEQDIPETGSPIINTSYLVYPSDYPDRENISTPHDHVHSFQPLWNTNHFYYGDSFPDYNYYNYDCENQIVSPPVPQCSYESFVTPKPTFYDSISYNPNEYYTPYCSVDPLALLPVYPFDEPLNLEQELIGEEYEETISTKMIIQQDDVPGSATVNHVTTYTVSEKSHFKTPQIEKLPQQIQYYFLLM